MNTTTAAAALNGRDARTMTPAEKILTAEIMFGTGSRQHRAAIARFGKAAK